MTVVPIGGTARVFFPETWLFHHDNPSLATRTPAAAAGTAPPDAASQPLREARTRIFLLRFRKRASSECRVALAGNATRDLGGEGKIPKQSAD